MTRQPISTKEGHMDSDPTITGPDARGFWRRGGVLAVVGAIIAFGLGAAYMSIGHSPAPHDLPIAVVGDRAAAEALEARAPGELDARPAPDLAAAKGEIRKREVYAAVVPGTQGVRELVVASAASNQVANSLRRTLGQPTPTNVPRVTDAAPLPPDDSAGSSIPLLVQVVILGGSVGILGLSSALPRLRSRPRRGVLPLAALVVYAIVFGLGLTVVSGAFGVGTDVAFLDRALALTLISFAVTASTAALVALVGPAGSGIAGLLYFVLGAQISGGNTAFEYLPPFWKALGEHLPGGAGNSLMRDVLYFPDASTAGPVAILAAYAGIGLIAFVLLNLIQARRGARRADVVGGNGTAAAAKAAA
jgi:hypothetical protein